MKLDVNVLRYLSKDEFRVLTAVEMGQKNVSSGTAAQCMANFSPCRPDVTPPHYNLLPSQHEIVPLPLIDSISGLK